MHGAARGNVLLKVLSEHFDSTVLSDTAFFSVPRHSVLHSEVFFGQTF